MQENKFHPILFSTPMVQAILSGQKFQTRRIIKTQPDLQKHTHIKLGVLLDGSGKQVVNYCTGNSSIVQSVFFPYGKVGDVLWVRETFVKYSVNGKNGKEVEYEYKADNSPIKLRWKPGIHMPKEACRLFLKITDIRVEQLQNISRGDAMAEGCPFPNIERQTDPKLWFQELWISINGKESWYENPCVWVISFERIERPINFLRT